MAKLSVGIILVAILQLLGACLIGVLLVFMLFLDSLYPQPFSWSSFLTILVISISGVLFILGGISLLFKASWARKISIIANIYSMLIITSLAGISISNQPQNYMFLLIGLIEQLLPNLILLTYLLTRAKKYFP